MSARTDDPDTPDGEPDPADQPATDVPAAAEDPTEPASDEPSTESTDAEPAKAEPAGTEAVGTESANAESTDAESGDTELAGTESVDDEPVEAEGADDVLAADETDDDQSVTDEVVDGEDGTAEAGRAADDAVAVSAEVVPPSRTDGFVAGLSNLIGGPIGRHASDSPRKFWTPMRVVLLIAVAVLALGWIQKQPCGDGMWQRGSQYTSYCYSDVIALYGAEGLVDKRIPYLEKRTDNASDPLQYVEYPVLTGALMFVAAVPTWLITDALPGLENSAHQIYYQITVLLLIALALLAVWAAVRMRPRRPFDAAMIAAAPAMVFTAYVNWDLLPVALCTLAVYAWSQRHPGWAGILIGLGVAAKLYPLFLLGPLLLLCWRHRRLAAFAWTAGSAALAWLVVNLPVMLLSPTGWAQFYTFNSERGVDWGTIWYIGRDLTGSQPGETDGWFASLTSDPKLLTGATVGLFVLWCVGIAALVLFAEHPPRLAALALLVVAGFLLTGKVWSQQYVLWLIPLVVLARPRWGVFLFWQACELVYFLSFYQTLLAQSGEKSLLPDWFFTLASAGRMASLVLLCALVVTEILRPDLDVVRIRRDGTLRFDDPDAGVLADGRDRGPLGRWRSRSGSGDSRRESPDSAEPVGAG